MTKKCCNCKTTKPVTEFYKQRNKPSGRCKVCKKELIRLLRLLKPERFKEATNKWYHNNKEYFVRYWLENKDKKSKNNKNYLLRCKTGALKRNVGARTKFWINKAIKNKTIK